MTLQITMTAQYDIINSWKSCERNTHHFWKERKILNKYSEIHNAKQQW